MTPQLASKLVVMTQNLLFLALKFRFYSEYRDIFLFLQMNLQAACSNSAHTVHYAEK